MKCANCGRDFDDNFKECPWCAGGQAPPPPQQPCANCGQYFEGALEECPHCHGGKDVADWPARMRKKFTDRATPAGEPPPTNLVLAILTALCCCMPLGVVAIVYAAMAEGNIRSGDYAAARQNAAQASNFITWGVILGILCVVAAIVLSVLGHR